MSFFNTEICHAGLSFGSAVYTSLLNKNSLILPEGIIAGVVLYSCGRSFRHHHSEFTDVEDTRYSTIKKIYICATALFLSSCLAFVAADCLIEDDSLSLLEVADVASASTSSYLVAYCVAVTVANFFSSYLE